MRAPGINQLSCVREATSSSEISVEETETPPCEDAPASLGGSSSEDESYRYCPSPLSPLKSLLCARTPLEISAAEGTT